MKINERRKTRNQKNIKIITQCIKFEKEYEDYIKNNTLPEKKMSKRKYLAKHLEVSLQQVDRYLSFFKCIPQIQKLIFDDIIPLSCTDHIGYKTKIQQENLYNTLKKEENFNDYIPRTRVIELAQADVSTTSVEVGTKFAESVISLLKPENGYHKAYVNPKLTMDKKCDAFAITNQGKKIVFQFKYHSEEYTESIKAVKEVTQAKLNYNADIAIAVTSTKFTKPAKIEAQKQHVILWDGDYLKKELCWDGTI